MRLTALLICAAMPVWADGCPTAPDYSAELDPLYDRLLVLQDEAEARQISRTMWEMWDDAPDGPSQEMLDEGMKARAQYDFVRAMDRLNALVSYCPFYAEGYNQRAFVNFLRQDYAAALPDLDETLKINPRHLGALSGKALTLLAMGEDTKGQLVLREALKLNPWLGERHLLRPIPGEEL